MNNRIRKLRKSLKLNQKDFAERIGLKQNAISYMEKKGATVTEQNIKNICSQFSVNENWLRTGNGKMFIENEKKQKEFFSIFNELSPVLQDYLLKTAKDLLETQSKMQETTKDDEECLTVEEEYDDDFWENCTIEEAEKVYKKRHSKSVQKKVSTALNTTIEKKNNLIIDNETAL